MGAYAESVGNEVYISGVSPDAYNLDAFGRLRVSNAVTLFDSFHLYGINPFYWDSITASGGTVTYSATENRARVSCTATTNSRAVHQTRQYFRYQSGKSMLIKFTGTFGAGTLYAVRRTSVGGSVTEERIAQASFTHDKLDGTGNTEFTINTSTSNIYAISFQFLGVGANFFSIADPSGPFFLANTIENANKRAGLYMLTAALPFRVEVFNDGTTTFKRMGFFDDNDGLFFEVQQAAGAADLDFFCCEIEAEDGVQLQEERGVPFGTPFVPAGKSLTTTIIPILSIRPKLTFGGKTNRAIIVPTAIELLADARDIFAGLYLNPTLTGAAFTSVNTNSIAEYDTTATAITGGTLIKPMLIDLTASRGIAQDILSKIPLTLNAAGTTADILTVAGRGIANNTTAWANFGWKEIY